VNHLQDYAASIVATAVSALSAIAFWVVRRVLTDTKRLSLLEQRQEMQHKEYLAAVSRLEKATDSTSANQARIATILDRIDRGDQ